MQIELLAVLGIYGPHLRPRLKMPAVLCRGHPAGPLKGTAEVAVIVDTHGRHHFLYAQERSTQHLPGGIEPKLPAQLRRKL